MNVVSLDHVLYGINNNDSQWTNFQHHQSSILSEMVTSINPQILLKILAWHKQYDCVFKIIYGEIKCLHNGTTSYHLKCMKYILKLHVSVLIQQ